MSRPSTVVDGRFATFVDVDGNPPHDARRCSVCRLFDGQRPNETRAEWMARITGIARMNKPQEDA